MLVEDDQVWRDMLAVVLNNEPDLEVVHAVGTKEAALSYCTGNQVDIVLMDINLTGDNLDGIQATLEITLMEKAIKVIALTSFDEQEIVIHSYTAGAVQYVSKSDFRKLPDIIRQVLRTDTPHEILVREFWRLKEAEQYSKLTAAEKEIVALSEAGAGRTQLMEQLGKSEGTLKNQITSIIRKFKAASMREVIRTIKSRGMSGKEFRR